ncbi:MAG: DUF5667 domain-containing protein [Anaerolineae bacterium]
MRRKLERALDECLSQLNTGEFGLEEVLARYPEHEAELRPLLRTAMLVRQVPQAVPSPEAKAAGRQRLLSAVAKKRREKAVARPGLLRRMERSAAILVQPLVRPQRQSLRLAQAVAALLIIVSLVSAGTLRVAAGSLPDSPLYPIKLATERVQLALTTTAASRARLHMSYSERRLEEARALLEAGKGLSEATLQAMKSENSGALTAIGQASEEERLNLLADFALLTGNQQETLEGIKAGAPPSDQGAVEEALEASEEHQWIATGAMIEPDLLLTPSPMPRPTDTATPVPPTDTVAAYAHAETPVPVPTATPVPPTATPIPKPTAEPTATSVPAPTETPVPTPQVEVPVQPTMEPTATPTPQVEVPSQPAVEPSVEPSPTLTATPSPMPTVTPTSTPTATPTSRPTAEPTATPTPQVEVPSQPVPDSSITNCRVSDAPQGAAVGEFPSGTRKVYIVFDYAYMAGEEVGIRVYDSVGKVLFDGVRTLSGDGTESIAFSAGEGGLAAGRYAVNVYHGGGVIRTIIWDVAEPGG